MKSFSEFSSDIINSIFENDERFYEDFGFKTIISEKSNIAPLKPQKWGDLENKSKKDAGKLYYKAIRFIIKAEKEYTKKINAVTRKIHNAKGLVDIKKFDSFFDKVINRGKKASEITDLLRGAILVKDDNDLEKAVKLVKKEFTVTEYEYKSKGEDKEYGYFGSHHFLVLVSGVNAEIQVMTRRLWSYKHQAHQIYTKYRSGSDVDDAIKQADTKLSKMIFAKGNK